jgi:lysophospholipase L1-like esterase
MLSGSSKTKETIMLECLIIGDSIAVGTHQFYPECMLQGKGGINSWQWNRMYPVVHETARTAIISLGTNDHIGVHTRSELETARKKIQSERVFWILPHGNLAASRVPITEIQQIVREIAAEYHDQVIVINGVQSDNIHPSWSGYRRIVEQVKK